MMKRTMKYIVGLAVLAITACNPNTFPEFSTADSFVAFDAVSLSIDENGGSISLPLTIASIDPVKTNIVYEVIDGTAKSGVNFNLRDESAVVSFDGTMRTATIDIDIQNLEGQYTGDLSFSIKLLNANGINIGADSTCTVTICDLDHPLADILGTYSVAGTENWDGDVTWKAEFGKDASDVSVVWIKNIAPGFPAVYGNVNEDHTEILLPLGQKGVYNSSYNALFVGFKPENGKLYYSDEGNLVLVKTDTGWALDDEKWGYGFLAVSVSSGSIEGWMTGFHPGVTFTKE